MRLKRALLGLFGVVLLGVAGFLFFTRHTAISAVEPPRASLFDRALVAKGGELAMLGNCNSCHTKQDGAAYAGGRPLETPFGTIYASNITPDPETGIGAWPEAAFRRALREGVRRDGAHLYPAFPYDHFTKLSDSDVSALYAFLMTREPVRAAVPANTLPFPWSQRALIAAWKHLFFRPGELKPDPTLSAELNRGAYLVEGLAHCGACHTPRNLLGAEENKRYLGGGEIEGWHAPALNVTSPAPVAWTGDQLFTYLRTGFVLPHGVAAGPMQAVANNLGLVAEPDVRAIATYIGAMLIPATAKRQKDTQTSGTTPQRQVSPRNEGASGHPDGAVIYAGACALCHEPTGQHFSAQGIPLRASKVIAMPDARNLARVVLEGINPPNASPAALMPGFAAALTDAQLTALMAYLRDTFSDQPSWSQLEDKVREARQSMHGP